MWNKMEASDSDRSGENFEITYYLLFILIATLVFSCLFEVSMHTLLSNISFIHSHAIDLVLGSVVPTVLAYVVLRRFQTLLRRTTDEVAMRKRTEEALQLERNKFMGILESMEDGIYIVNDRHDIQYVNPVLERTFGPVGGRKCHEYFHDRSESCPWCKNDRVFSGENVQWIWHSNKTDKTYYLFDTPLRNADGTISKLEIFRDITELKMAEKALRESEERYRTLFHRANDSILFVSMTPEGAFGRFIDANDVACDTLGYTREEMQTLTPFDIVVPEMRQEIQAGADKLLSEEHILVERVFLSKDGRRIPVEINSHLFEYDGRPTVLAIARDISERKMAELSLRMSEREYQRLSQEFNALLDAIPDGIVLVSNNLEVLWANRETIRWANKSLSDMTGKHCYELLHNRTEPCWNCPTLRAFQSGRMETEMAVHKGRFLDKRSVPVVNGEVSTAIILSRDVTERINLQAEAMQAAHLASLGELSAGMAHEINNPINGIINYAQILINKTASGGLESDIASRIMKESERVARIVRNLLSFAKIDDTERMPARIETIVSDILTLTQTQLRKDGIKVDVSIPGDLAEVRVNFQQIQQVFLNVINNARYALNQKHPQPHADKRIAISAEIVEEAPRRLRITFLDRGCGISPEVMERVKTPFFSTKPRGKGTGLGLALSERIIKDHGGRLVLESIEGEHTRVVVELPIERTP